MLIRHCSISSFVRITFYLSFFIYSLFFNISDVKAAATYTDVFYSTNPGLLTQCIDRSGCDRPPLCWNSERAGVTNCGPACNGGNPWTKYEYKGCFQRSYDEIRNEEDCVRAFQETNEQVCSTADKCTTTSNNPYLNAGRCDCTVLGVYKTCCTNTSPSFVASDSCVQIAVDTINPPWEGVCPAGSSPKFCGFEGYPPCGQEACGPITPVTCSLSPRTPNPYNQCGGTCSGITYPSNHTLEVTESSCSDGTTQYSCLDLGGV